jgi:hypothetical protein
MVWKLARLGVGAVAVVCLVVAVVVLLLGRGDD